MNGDQSVKINIKRIEVSIYIPHIIRYIHMFLNLRNRTIIIKSLLGFNCRSKWQFKRIQERNRMLEIGYLNDGQPFINS